MPFIDLPLTELERDSTERSDVERSG